VAGQRARKKKPLRSKKSAASTQPLSDKQRSTFSKRLSQLVPAQPFADQRATATRLARSAPRRPPSSIKPNLPSGITERAYKELLRLAPASADTGLQRSGPLAHALAPKSPPKHVPYA
jgi:hypothetical protein